MTNQTTKPYYPTRSWREYRRKYPNAGVILELRQKHRNLPASRWGKEHLIACRLIHNTSGNILPVLKGFAPKPNDLDGYKEWDNIKRLVDGLQQGDLTYKCPLELEQENGNLGPFWSALAKCVALKDPVEARERPQREKRKVLSKGYVSSEDIQISLSDTEEAASEDQQVGSSSHQSSQQSYRPGSSGGDGVDDDEHTDRTKSEAVTVNLAGAFIRYVLSFCARQNPGNGTVLEFREEPLRVRRNLSSLIVDATDDGGIWIMETKERNKCSWTWRSRLALLEAKKAFQRIDDNNQPVVSDAHLSQYTCEALTAFLDCSDQDEVFVVAVTQTFMRFLNIHRTKDYMEYLKCTNVEQQRASNAYLRMTETESFALDTRVGRRHAVCNLIGLVRFWEKRWEQDTEEAEGNEEDVESGYADKAVSAGNDDLVGYEGDSGINTDNHDDDDNGPKVRKRKRHSS